MSIKDQSATYNKEGAWVCFWMENMDWEQQKNIIYNIVLHEEFKLEVYGSGS